MTTTSIVHPNKKSKATAYGLWCLCFLGVCGAQRFYANKLGSGILYVITFGMLGFGQLIDLFLTAEMIDSYNRGQGYNLPGAYNSPLAQQQVVVNVGESIATSLSGGLVADCKNTQESKKEEQKILEACIDQPITIARISVQAEIEPKKVKALVEHLEAEGMLTASISESGQIKYWIN